MTEHKWAKELQAIAEGKEVEGCPSDLAARDFWVISDIAFNPLTHPDCKWRVKPEKKALRHRVAKMKRNSNTQFLAFALRQIEADGLENDEFFIEWAGDWQEVEVE